MSKCKERERERERERKVFRIKIIHLFFINFEKNEGCVCVFFEKRFFKAWRE